MPKTLKTKTGGKTIKINVRKPAAEKLLDAQALPKKSARISRVVAISAAVGFILGGWLLAYLFFSKNPATPDFTPEIIVPEDEESLAEPIPEPQAAPVPTPTPPAVEIQQVLILDTPLGYLNVREGPGTNFAKIGQVNPGETYELVSEDATAWYQIRLDASRTGWVTKKHAEVK